MNQATGAATDPAYASPERIRERQDALLVRMLKLAGESHPAYRRRWREDRIDPRSIRGVADLDRLAVTTKADYTAEPEAYRLDPDMLIGPEASLWDVMYTSGTSTGRPAPFFSTTYDYYNILEVQRLACRIRGIGAEDVIANLYPFTPYPHGAFTRCSQAAGVIGATLVVGGNGKTYGPHPVHRSTDEVVALLERTQPTVLWGVASYLRRLLTRAGELDARLRRVRICAVSGEPLPAAMRKDLRDRLAALGSPKVVINDSLGATEMQSGLVECAQGSGLHNPAPHLYHLAVVDEDGRTLPLGSSGALALTHLDRRGTVLLRYLTGDVVTLTEDPCPLCGRAGGRVVSRPRRTDRLTKIRGTLVDVDALVAAVSQVPGTSEFQVQLTREDVLDPLSMETVVVSVVPPLDIDWLTLHDAVVDATKTATNLTPRVVAARLDDLVVSDTELKTRRLVDLRESLRQPL